MYLQVKFENGSTLDVSLSRSHTVHVIDATNHIQDGFAFNDVADVTFHHGEPGVPDVPAESPTAEVDTGLDAGEPKPTADTGDTPEAPGDADPLPGQDAALEAPAVGPAPTVKPTRPRKPSKPVAE